MNGNTRLTVVFARAGAGYGARIPDLPGCTAAGKTLGETRGLIQDAAHQFMQRTGEVVLGIDFLELWDCSQ